MPLSQNTTIAIIASLLFFFVALLGWCLLECWVRRSGVLRTQDVRRDAGIEMQTRASARVDEVRRGGVLGSEEMARGKGGVEEVGVREGEGGKKTLWGAVKAAGRGRGGWRWRWGCGRCLSDWIRSDEMDMLVSQCLGTIFKMRGHGAAFSGESKSDGIILHL